MIKRFSWVFFVVMAWPSVFGQGLVPQDGTFLVDHPLWNSSYMPTYRDQFVHGEGYRLYPGPLPKVLYALGLDTKGPAVDWEMLVNLDRDVPTWFGICNGWAASAIIFGEPNAIVVNGVKIMPGDHKSFLTTIFKDITAQYFGDPDPVAGGMTPESFEQILFRFVVEENQTLVFDVALDEEVWNYPIKGFIRESEEIGEWTYVTITALFPGLTQINDSVDSFFTQEFVYEFRFHTVTKSQFEWLGDSVEDHPQTAWLPRLPYLKGVDVANANHYYSIETYEELLEKASAEDNRVDLQEPNNAMADAFAITNELVLGSLLLDDIDYYSISAEANEPISFDFKIYNGQAVNFSVIDPQGNDFLIVDDTQAREVQFLAPTAGKYIVKISQKEDAFVESYYQLVFPEDASHFEVNELGEGIGTARTAKAINTRDEALVLSGGGVDSVEPYGSRDLANDVGTFKATNRVLWSETFAGQSGALKQYFLDHEKTADYVVPHVTCRNGWKTTLDIRRQAKMPVKMLVHGQDGALLESIELPFGNENVYQGDIASLASVEVLNLAAWISFETTAKLRGFAVFTDVHGWPIRIDITARPRFGDMLVFDLREETKGGTGLAVVSTARTENELIYWVDKGNGDEVARGTFTLQPGQKWLTTVSALVDVPMEDDFVFYLHSQFAVEGVVVQVTPDSIYGHRILGQDLDNLHETYVTLPQDRSDSGFIFANFNDRARHVLFEGYGADGELQGRFNIELGNPLNSKEVRRVPLQQIFDNGVGIKDLNAITHFRITSVDPFYGMELSGTSTSASPVVIPMKNVYENP